MTNTPKSFADVVELIVSYIQMGVIPIIFGIAVVTFFYALVNYIQRSGDEKERTKAVQLMVWSIVGLFIMLSVWGLVQIITRSFGVSNFGLPLLKE